MKGEKDYHNTAKDDYGIESTLEALNDTLEQRNVVCYEREDAQNRGYKGYMSRLVYRLTEPLFRYAILLVHRYCFLCCHILIISATVSSAINPSSVLNAMVRAQFIV